MPTVSRNYRSNKIPCAGDDVRFAAPAPTRECPSGKPLTIPAGTLGRVSTQSWDVVTVRIDGRDVRALLTDGMLPAVQVADARS